MQEAMLQSILKDWFRRKGYRTSENVIMPAGNSIDLVAKSEQEEWLIEIKGDYEKLTSQYNTNFDTGIGQILKSVDHLDAKTKYAICIPYSSTERGEKFSYRLILPKYSKTIMFEKLNIHLILVRNDRSVEIIEPLHVKDFLSKV